MVWIGPLGSIMTALVLVIIGAMPSQGVPNTLAVAQFVEAVPGSEDQKIQGLLAIYNRETSDATIGTVGGGIFQPDMSGLEGEIHRMVWTDLDTWHWENLTFPSGVRFAPFQFFARSSKRIEARGRFGPDGLTGIVSSGSFENPGDAIIATPAKESFAVRLNAEGLFEVGPGDLLAPGQFITGQLLSDEQRRRQSIYRQMIPGPHRKKYPEKATLLSGCRCRFSGGDVAGVGRSAGDAVFVSRPDETDRVGIVGNTVIDRSNAAEHRSRHSLFLPAVPVCART